MVVNVVDVTEHVLLYLAVGAFRVDVLLQLRGLYPLVAEHRELADHGADTGAQLGRDGLRLNRP